MGVSQLRGDFRRSTLHKSYMLTTFLCQYRCKKILHLFTDPCPVKLWKNKAPWRTQISNQFFSAYKAACSLFIGARDPFLVGGYLKLRHWSLTPPPMTLVIESSHGQSLRIPTKSHALCVSLTHLCLFSHSHLWKQSVSRMELGSNSRIMTLSIRNLWMGLETLQRPSTCFFPRVPGLFRSRQLLLVSSGGILLLFALQHSPHFNFNLNIVFRWTDKRVTSAS